MYSFVLKQLSPIQKGVQTAHAIVEFANKYGDVESYKEWSDKCKTIIMLDGGTYKEMNDIMSKLSSYNVDYATFYEPDLDYLPTAITVLVDERVFDKDKYPDYVAHINPPIVNDVMLSVYIKPEPYEKWVERIGGDTVVKLRELIFSKHLSK